jgi:excisionase family DNA binding protein
VKDSLIPNPELENLPPLHELVGKNYVTLRQLKDLLGVTYQTVLRYVREEKVRAVKVGGSWRIYEDELRRFLSSGNWQGE